MPGNLLNYSCFKSKNRTGKAELIALVNFFISKQKKPTVYYVEGRNILAICLSAKYFCYIYSPFSVPGNLWAHFSINNVMILCLSCVI